MRKKPYTQIGISRIPCKRCGKPSVHQWQICADGNQFRGLCLKCDILVNKVILKFMRFQNWKSLLNKYIKAQ